MLGALGFPIIMVGLALGVFSVILVFARNFKKCPPNMALVVYGRKRKDGTGFRLITGGSALVIPLLENYTFIPLGTISIAASVTDTPNIDGVPVSVEATANVKVSSDRTRLAAAVERMLGKRPEEISEMLKITMDGLLRQIIGTLTIEAIIKEREKLAQQVLSGATTELNKLGFEIDVFVVNKVSDKGGYIESLGAKRTAEVKRDAAIAQAEATKEATVKSSLAKQQGESARLAAEQQIAEANRDLSLKQAAFKKETETAQAEAEMARALKTAEVDKDLRRRRVEAEASETQARIALAEQEAARTEKELQSTVIRPAEAQARAAVVTAEGNASAAIRQADATRATAEAEKSKLTFEGEGHAAAEAAQRRMLGLAEADANRARGEAEGAAIRAKGEAEGAAILARLGAEAEGLQKKNDAMARMSPEALRIIVLERLPQIIDEVGEAGQKIVGAAFEPVGAGLSRIDNVNIVDLGGSNGNGEGGIAKFAGSIPEVVFGALTRAKALGMDVDGILEKLGVPKGALTGLLDGMNMSGKTLPVDVDEVDIPPAARTRVAKQGT